MTTPRRPRQELYEPRVGELVLDRATGKEGIYQATESGEAYLRPAGGGREWTTTPRELAPVVTVEGAA